MERGASPAQGCQYHRGWLPAVPIHAKTEPKGEPVTEYHRVWLRAVPIDSEKP
jgi:hypothetical protein